MNNIFLSERFTENAGAARTRQFRYLEICINLFVVVLIVSNIVGVEDRCRGAIPHQRSPVAVSGHLHFRRRLHGGVWIRSVTTRHLDWFLRLGSVGHDGDGCRMATSRTGLGAIRRHSRQFLGSFRGMVAASLVAYWCGEFANAFVLSRMKVLTNGRYLWARTIGSTVVGQAVDTALVMTLAFSGSLSSGLIANLIVSRLCRQSGLRDRRNSADLRGGELSETARGRRCLRYRGRTTIRSRRSSSKRQIDP